MSLLVDEEQKDLWRGVLERRFVAAAQTEEEYVLASRRAHQLAKNWIESEITMRGSFLWVCDVLDLESDAVRRSLKEKGPVPNIADLM